MTETTAYRTFRGEYFRTPGQALKAEFKSLLSDCHLKIDFLSLHRGKNQFLDVKATIALLEAKHKEYKELEEQGKLA